MSLLPRHMSTSSITYCRAAILARMYYEHTKRKNAYIYTAIACHNEGACVFLQAELIAEVKEGRMDETRRVALHAQWLAGQEDRDMRDLLDAIKRGFRRKRRHAAGLDDDDVSLGGAFLLLLP